MLPYTGKYVFSSYEQRHQFMMNISGADADILKSVDPVRGGLEITLNFINVTLVKSPYSQYPIRDYDVIAIYAGKRYGIVVRQGFAGFFDPISICPFDLATCKVFEASLKTMDQLKNIDSIACQFDTKLADALKQAFMSYPFISPVFVVNELGRYWIMIDKVYYQIPSKEDMRDIQQNLMLTPTSLKKITGNDEKIDIRPEVSKNPVKSITLTVTNEAERIEALRVLNTLKF